MGLVLLGCLTPEGPQGASASLGFLLSRRGERTRDMGSLSLNRGHVQPVSVQARMAPGFVQRPRGSD